MELFPRSIGQYILKGVIGQGAFSTVCLCQQMESNMFFACKIIARSRLLLHNLESRFENEIRIIQQLHHPGIVALFDLLKDETNFYVIMEFCPNGELFSHVVGKGRLDENEAKIFISQVLFALQHIHSLGICHRDLKPENILLDQSGVAKISDLGLSRFVGHDGLVSTPCGSPCYASPECVSGREYDGRKSDIWSCGVIAYAILTGQLPWTKRNQTQLFEQIRRGEYAIPMYLSEKCRSFIAGLMTVNTDHRLTIEQALHHQWLSDCTLPNIEMYSALSGFEPVQTAISLRRLDIFFEKEIEMDEEEDNASEETPPSITTSQKFNSFRKTLIAIRYRERGSSPLFY